MADSDKPKSELSFPKDNVAVGLAWSYFYGFLNIILPKIPNAFSTMENRDPDIPFCDKIILLIPESCDCRTPLMDYDKEHIQKASRLVIKQDRAGIVARDYGLDVYKLKHPKDQHKEMYAVMVLNATVHSMYEMMMDKRIQFSQEELRTQRQMFAKNLEQIIKTTNGPECEEKSVIITFDDSPNAAKSLSEAVFDAIK